MFLVCLLSFLNLFGSKKDNKKSKQISIVEITQELGISPGLAIKYQQNIDQQAKTFSCFDGSKIINLSLFNNNYCDCNDCSDEPGSPASANFAAMTTETKDKDGNDLLSYFYCQNPGYVPELIPRWNVGDGICSCCDGADEAFNPHAECTNKCKKLEKKREKLVGSVDQAYRRGNEKYKVLMKEGQEHQVNADQVYAKYHSQIERLEKAKADINNAKERYIPTPTPQPEPEIEQDSESEINPEEDIESENGHYDNEEDYHKNDDDQVYAEKMGDDQFDENENKNNEQNPAEEEKEKSQEEKDIEEEIRYENNGTNCSQTNDKEFFYSFNFSFCIDDSENPYPKGLTYDQKTDRRNALSDKIDELNNKMNSEENTIRFYNTNVPPELKILGGQEFTKGDYKFTFLEEIKESYTSYGKFKDYRNGEFIFEDGAYCWETSCGKKTWMRFICWDENALVSVTESSICEYKAVFATPAVCTDDYVEKAANMTVEQLKFVRKEAGI